MRMPLGKEFGENQHKTLSNDRLKPGLRLSRNSGNKPKRQAVKKILLKRIMRLTIYMTPYCKRAMRFSKRSSASRVSLIAALCWLKSSCLSNTCFSSLKYSTTLPSRSRRAA